ncbi:WAP domain containing protein, SLPI-like [Trichuris trichiura]|uniref:WAP domain containing protein, SLPI-like n=1 Tax=Trichuris trichiura TaxID=36087 RepID=A0A077Z8Y1_TRITR|nr:WAP domain containing protein, SLPI-like [Trichuris trichiura]
MAISKADAMKVLFRLLCILLSIPSLAWAGICPDGALPIIDCVTNECPGGYRCEQGSCCRLSTLPANRPPSQDSPSTAPVFLRQRNAGYDGSKKPGSCPPSVDHATATAATPCQNDFQCQSDWKCCPTVSGTFCIEIVSSSGKTKHRNPELLVMCIVDDECEPPLKCVNSRRGRVCAMPMSSKQVCPINEEVAQCTSSCQTGCFKNDPSATCRDTYCRPGCMCRSGFIRLHHNDWKSPCIPLTKCTEILRSNPAHPGDVHVPENRRLPVNCETNLHCSNGYVCHSGTCVPGWHEIKDPSDCAESKGKSIVGGITQDECATDFDCPKAAQCTQSARGRQCKSSRVSAASTGSTALCPNGRQPSSRCAMNECTSGYTCWNGICCPLDNNAKVANRNSGCPPVRSLSSKGQVHFCDSDSDCFPNENCCPTAAGRQCMNTRTISSSIAAVQHRCSDGSRSVQVCYSDLECKNGMVCENGLCCSQKTERSGQCPQMYYQPTDAKPRDHCTSDDECLDLRRKCCPTLSGKRCLFHTGVSDIYSTEEHMCFDGSRPAGACRLNVCPSGYYCEDGYCCRRRQSYDAVRHNSQCPSLNFMKNLESFPSCISNSDCINGTVCCPALSGSKCVHAESNNSRNQDSSDTCETGSKPLGLVPLRCEDDSRCPSGTRKAVKLAQKKTEHKYVTELAYQITVPCIGGKCCVNGFWEEHFQGFVTVGSFGLQYFTQLRLDYRDTAVSRKALSDVGINPDKAITLDQLYEVRFPPIKCRIDLVAQLMYMQILLNSFLNQCYNIFC